MTRRPAWTDAAGLTHWTDEHGQVGHHTPRLGAGCKCRPTREGETGSGGALSTPLTASQPDQVSPDPVHTPGLYGEVLVAQPVEVRAMSGVEWTLQERGVSYVPSAEGQRAAYDLPADEVRSAIARSNADADRILAHHRTTGRAMGSHQSHRAGTTTWLTPPHIIEALGPFDLDPCAAPSWPTARRHYILPTDGLAEPWEGRVWLNPPYGAEVWTWLSRLAEHGDGIALIFARTETAGFVREVWSKADAVMFLHGRLHFHHADGTRAAANSGAPSCLVAYGQRNVDALRASGLAGTVVQ